MVNKSKFFIFAILILGIILIGLVVKKRNKESSKDYSDLNERRNIYGGLRKV